MQATSYNVALINLSQQPELGEPIPHETTSHLIRIDAREGFFHAMFSYRVNPDQDFVTKIHDRTHSQSAGSFGQFNAETHTLDYCPWPRSFRRDESFRNSSIRLFQDSYCLKDGVRWEGDGGVDNGGFLGALRLSIVFAPVFSAQKKDGIVLPVGSVGQMIHLSEEDTLDNVLLELIVARELHLLSRHSSTKALFPCSYILPLFRSEYVWEAAKLLPKTPSTQTNTKAHRVMLSMGIPNSALSEELRKGTLSVAEVWSFFCQFQGIKLYENGSEKFQIDAAARSIIRVVKDSISEHMFRVMDTNCAQLYELFGFLSEQNIPYYTGILAAHNITSVYQLAVLSERGATKIAQLIAEKGTRQAYASSLACELVKLRSAVAVAKASPLSGSLNSRFLNFIDSDASLVTVLQSSSLFEILLSKKTALVAVFMACLVAALFTLINHDSTTTFAESKTMFAIFQTCAIVIYGVQMLAMVVAHVASPRQGKYVLSFAAFLWFCLNMWSYAVSVRSAVYEECRTCAKKDPVVLSQNSAVLNVMSQTCWPPVFAALSILMLYKQNWCVPLCLIMISTVILVPAFVSIYSLPTASNTLLVFSNGGGYNVPLMLFWLLLYLLFRVFLRIGNQHALGIYARNSAIANKAYLNMNPDDMERLRLLTHSQPTTSVSGKLGIALDKLQKASAAPIVQPHASFESLIKDAEFINYPLQEWVSTWLGSSDANMDAASKYLCSFSDDGDRPHPQSPEDAQFSGAIQGIHVRGPVKHIDRAIAKVASALRTFVSLFFCFELCCRRTVPTRATSGA